MAGRGVGACREQGAEQLPGEAVRFQVVLGYKWTQIAAEFSVFIGKTSLA